MEFLVLLIVLFLFLIDMNISRVGKELESLNKNIEDLTQTVWRSRDE